VGGHHHHGPHDRAGERHRRPLALAFALTAAYLVVELVSAIAVGSLTLLSDAGHMATDALGLGMALAAIHAASRSRLDGARTFGLYRLEILAALANAVLLLVIGVYVLVEAVRRLVDPEPVDATTVVVVGVLGLVVNLVAMRLLRPGSGESLNVEGAYLEVVADLLGSIAVVIGATVWGITGWEWVDPVLGAAIALFIVPRAIRLGREALRILVQAAPPEVDLAAVRDDLGGIPGVVDVHDLHVWTLTSDMEVLSAHVMVRADTDAHGVLDQARDLLRDRHGLVHATIQVEPDDHHGCEDLSW
jgi:cobalt-zinc-cadmium efflux system protein